MGETHRGWKFRGRGAIHNPTGRFEARQTLPIDDGWGSLEQQEAGRLETHLHPETAREIVSTNQSPDLAFGRTINPYQGCEHGCVYCYARPSHAYWNRSPGLEFETEIYYKPDAAALLEHTFRKPRYSPAPILIGGNTDPYQPSERRLGLTRQILEVMLAFQHPVSLITRSNLILRDLDLLVALAEKRLVAVMLSLTTLNPKLARVMEPRAPTPQRRLEAIRCLAGAGVPVGVMTAPLIPALNEPELEKLLEAAAEAGAATAGYTLVRLPYELKDVFLSWLEQHFPDSAGRIEARIRDLRDGELNQSDFGVRMRGVGPFADLIRARFKLACRRLNLAEARSDLDSSRFVVPPRPGDQLSFFGV